VRNDLARIDRDTLSLHPAQCEYVDRAFNGPARAIGSAGTGQTVVAIHEMEPHSG